MGLHFGGGGDAGPDLVEANADGMTFSAGEEAEGALSSAFFSELDSGWCGEEVPGSAGAASPLCAFCATSSGGRSMVIGFRLGFGTPES